MEKTFLFYIFLLCFSLHINGQSTASQQVSTFTIEATQLDTEKTIWVYLPKSYDTSEKQYPVIYIFDAQNLFDANSSFVGEWKVDEYLDTLTDNESIIIGVEHGNDKRIEELTPYKHATYGGGNGDTFLNFIMHILKPHIDLNYRTLSDSKHTTIFGSSLGGLLAFYAVLQYSDTFGNAGIFSPAFWVNPEIYDLASEGSINQQAHFYFLAGTDESETMISNLEKMITILKTKGIGMDNIKLNIIEGGKHNEELWSTNFPDAYQWILNSQH
jgi:alpha-glucosidase